MSSIRNAIETASARELFELARHLGDEVRVVRPESDGYVSLTTGDIAELLLAWAEEDGLVAAGAEAATSGIIAPQIGDGRVGRGDEEQAGPQPTWGAAE